MNKEQKKFETFRDNFIKSKLRQMSLRWKPRGEALKAARKERGRYECGMCKSLVKVDQIQLDHIHPVIPLTGPVLNEDGTLDLNSWCRRLFVDVSGWMALCKPCHEAKTASEDKMRSFHSEKRKQKLKKKKD